MVACGGGSVLLRDLRAFVVMMFHRTAESTFHRRPMKVPMPRLRSFLLFTLAAAVAGVFAHPLSAQDERVPTGVRIGLLYETSFRPRLAVRPFEVDPADRGVSGAAREINEIIERDLDYSDRFEMFRDIPRQAREGAVDYDVWNALGVVFLVTAEVEPRVDGQLLRVALHDVVYGHVKDRADFRLPPPEAGDFRMAVHAVGDEIVRWATGQAGMAASRVAFVRAHGDGSYELLVVDSDGENPRRVLRSDDVIMSPAWSPDGGRLVYAVGKAGAWEIHERDLRTERVTVVSSRPGLNYTPRYSPDGRRLAMTLSTDRGATDVFEYDLDRNCCLRRLTHGPRADLSPAYSPDGRRLVFNSDRLGPPHIYIMSANGGDATLLTRFVYGEPGYYTSPDWSPTNSLIAFHGRSRGDFQIMVADADRPGATVQQITQDGRSEDPSWAPDGRHLVFSGIRGRNQGLFVVDSVTGRLRPLVTGARYLVPDWSPPLLDASVLMVRGGQ